MNRQIKQAHELAEDDWLMIAGGNYQVVGHPFMDAADSMVVHLRRHPLENPCMEMSLRADLIVIVYTK